MLSITNLSFVALALGSVSCHIPDLPGAKWATLDGKPVEFYAHRGMKSQQPQHTYGSYWLASINGAEYIEPDLVLTKDGVPVCFHDLHIEGSTNVKDLPEFNHLKRNFTGIIDNSTTTLTDAYFISDFTFKELSKVRVIQEKIGLRPQFYNQIFKIPSFQQFLDNANHLAYVSKKPINIVPELKSSKFHGELRPENPRYFENKVLEILRNNGYPLKKGDKANCQAKTDVSDGKKCGVKESKPVQCGKVTIQNFDFESLKYLSSHTDPEVIEHAYLGDKNAWMFTKKGLDIVAKYAQWYSVSKDFHLIEIPDVLKANKVKINEKEVAELGGFILTKDLVKECHARKLKVLPWTFNDSREPSKFGCKVQCFKGDARDEYYHFFKLGVDGMFVETLPEATQLRAEFNTMLKYNISL